MSRRHTHRSHRGNRLRAAVLGANDGIVSTASLVIGVASAGSSPSQIVISGIAGMVAGALSMAAGEYVSVSSQADTERADLEMEQRSLDQDYDYELRELAAIYKQRGLTAELASQVAEQLMAKDALGAHARDEIGISTTIEPKPVQAAVVSAVAFTAGASTPVLLAAFAPLVILTPVIGACSLVLLAVTGAVAARIGGAPVLRGTMRVVFWGAAAMGITAGIGSLFGI